MLKHFKSTIHWTMLIILVALALPLQAKVRVELDRARIVEGETVTLTFLTDDPGQNLDADLSALEKNFEVLDRRSETQLSIVNGRQTAVVRMLLTLEPRAAGEYTIPPLTVGGESTPAINLTVDPAPELEPGTQPPVFIEVEVAPTDGPYYVHGQLGLTVRVFYQQNLTEAAISPPEPAPAAVRLMQETPYQAERGGERYRVLERNYAVFPERSGELSIPPMKLTGRLVERRTSSVWQPAVRGRRVQVESEALVLDIKPKPTGFSGVEWQPAREYRLTQQVSSGDTLRVGEPVTRTVIIDAVGLEENMIVEPAWPDLPDTRIYPDQPQGITRDDGQWVLGHKEFRYAVVPEKEGELVLPELKVEWWDTQNNRARTAVLAAHTVRVKPSALVPPSAQPDVSATAGAVPEVGSGPGEPGYWRWLALLFVALWLLTLFAALALWKRRMSGGGMEATEALIPEQESALLTGLQKACSAGEIRPARRALQDWLREYGPVRGNGSLLEFAATSGSPEIRDSIYILDGSGFRPDSGTGSIQSWDGRAFWKNFEGWRRSYLAEARQHKPPVTDLYAMENRSSP
jgi:hypothetical protein